ncbi:hypothetical protein AAFF_G00051640 [Aldrovandia affinis]|uniref:Uncharacterized protein n=1 Tax=Aldrovandia affinis TaxID=143900 RepID=A0AAD7T4K9_9TELE|nr:hypothetical protein AAFF_G00051640 [Aldrovandia affinis]
MPYVSQPSLKHRDEAVPPSSQPQVLLRVALPVGHYPGPQPHKRSKRAPFVPRRPAGRSVSGACRNSLAMKSEEEGTSMSLPSSLVRAAADLIQMRDPMLHTAEIQHALGMPSQCALKIFLRAIAVACVPRVKAVRRVKGRLSLTV